MDAVNWRGLDVNGARLDLVQSVQFARAYGALVSGQVALVVVPTLGPVSSAFSEPRMPRTATAIAK